MQKCRPTKTILASSDMDVAKMRAFKKQTVDLVVYFIVRLIICVVQAMPVKACDQLAWFLAFVAADVFKIRAKLIDDNLEKVFPLTTGLSRKQTSRAMWRHLCMMVFEIAHAPRKIHETNWRDFVSIKSKREVVKYLLMERPKALVSGHFGNFEIGGFVTGLIGFPGYTVARKMDNPYLDRWVKSFREEHGQYILDTVGSSAAIQEQLERNQCLVLLGDQHTELGAVWVDFLGRQAACHKSLAVFTLSCDSPMLVVYTKRVSKFDNSRSSEPMKFEIGCQGIADPDQLPDEINGVRDLTIWYNQILGEIILKNPEQYWWVHNRWKPKPDRKKKAAIMSKRKAA